MNLVDIAAASASIFGQKNFCIFENRYVESENLSRTASTVMARKSPIREIADDEIVVFETRFPSGVRDFVLQQRIDHQTYQVINPLELLGTRMAVRVLNLLGSQSRELAAQFSLSRLLVQCLEYRGNRRHLVVEPWDVEDLRGERIFEGNRTDFARDCGEHQANRFQLIMAGAEEPEMPAGDLYWGTFSTLPTVEDMFDDPDLGEMATTTANPN